jgi:hypothetical protein
MPEIPESLIRERSYRIWLREGCPNGEALRHWLEAKKELETELRGAQFPQKNFDYRDQALPRPTISHLPRRRSATGSRKPDDGS